MVYKLMQQLFCYFHYIRRQVFHMFGGTKRFRVAGGDVEMLDSMAHALMLLSHGHTGGAAGGAFLDASTPSSAPARVFECKTCSRQFTSFQALGGHRASHKKPKIAASSDGGWEAARPRVHECSICGLEFAIGQALGGHMRRHRVAITEGLTQGVVVVDEGERQRRKTEEKRAALPWLDLNVEPTPTPTAEISSEAAASCRKKIFGFELVDTTSVAVDCFR